MAIIKSGILGGGSGSVGPVTMGSWKGKDYIRSKPTSVANPKTAAQVGQRTKLSTLVAFAKEILVPVIKPLWDRFAQGMSGYNHFIQQNIAQVSAAGAITYASIRTSIGSLLGQSINAIGSADADTNVDITFTDNSGEGSALATDTAYVVVYNETQDVFGTGVGDPRSDAEANVEMPVACASGDVLHAWLAFRRADGTLVSNSSYATDVVA